MSITPGEEKSKAAESEMPSMTPQSRVLGKSWDVTTDEFFFTTNFPDYPVAKRGILVITNSLYDHLGFVTPVVLLDRLLYSEICREKFDWDGPGISPEFIISDGYRGLKA